MKKIRVIALVLALVLMVGLLASCGLVGTCDYCGENGILSTVEVLGVETKMCSDCEKTLDEVADLIS